MQEQKSRIPVGLLVGLSAVMLAAGSATAYFTWQRTQAPKLTPTPSAVSQSPAPLPSVSALPTPTSSASSAVPSTAAVPQSSAPTAQVYWLNERGSEIQLTQAPVKTKASDRPEAVLTAAMNQVLGNPPDSTLTTAIPKRTELRSLKVKSDGIHVDLSKAFTTGGGSLSMTTRVAQVLYTATSVDPKAPVFLTIEGKPLETLGGEGLMIDQPLTRLGFEQSLGQKGE